jgi:hypothetical protein
MEPNEFLERGVEFTTPVRAAASYRRGIDEIKEVLSGPYFTGIWKHSEGRCAGKNGGISGYFEGEYQHNPEYGGQINVTFFEHNISEPMGCLEIGVPAGKKFGMDLVETDKYTGRLKHFNSLFTRDYPKITIKNGSESYIIEGKGGILSEEKNKIMREDLAQATYNLANEQPLLREPMDKELKLYF